MSAVVATLVAEFETAARAAQAAEAALRKQMVEELARLERQRAFAYRRLNLMGPVTEAAADEEAALASGLATARAELGWDSESETRSETLARFADVVRAIFESCAETEEAPATEISRALAAFESWYTARYQRPFWMLFEQYIPEMPLVERWCCGPPN